MHNHRNAGDWLTPTLALAVWAAHFLLLWTASSIFPDQPTARWLAAALTVPAAAALVWLWRRGKVWSLASLPGLGVALAALGMLYNLLPAIVG